MPSSTLSCFLALIIMENFHMAREKKLIHFPLFYYTLEDRYTWLIFPSTQFPPPVGVLCPSSFQFCSLFKIGSF